MKKLFIFLLIGLIVPFCTNAQLKNRMAMFEGKPGVTLTQLDKSLYGLYKNDRYVSEAGENLLKNLSEVNILNIDLQVCDSNLLQAVYNNFRPFLSSSFEKYKLVKSFRDSENERLIYAKSKGEVVTELVVWNQTPRFLNIIELKGDIYTDKIALLAKLLNIKSLYALSDLSTENSTSDESSASEIKDHLQEVAKIIKSRSKIYFGGHEYDSWKDLVKMFKETNRLSQNLKDSLQQGADLMGLAFDAFREHFTNYYGEGDRCTFTFGDGLEIKKENGKTKIKILSENSEPNFLIDGEIIPQKEVYSDKVHSVCIVGTQNKKSYITVISTQPLGEYISYKNHILTFRYKNKIYKYNLAESDKALLWVKGENTYDFTILPEQIHQIRPVSKTEKELNLYNGAEVFISTK